MEKTSGYPVVLLGSKDTGRGSLDGGRVERGSVGSGRELQEKRESVGECLDI